MTSDCATGFFSTGSRERFQHFGRNVGYMDTLRFDIVDVDDGAGAGRPAVDEFDAGTLV